MAVPSPPSEGGHDAIEGTRRIIAQRALSRRALMLYYRLHVEAVLACAELILITFTV